MASNRSESCVIPVSLSPSRTSTGSWQRSTSRSKQRRSRLAQAGEEVRLRERRASGVVRSDERFLTKDRSERLGWQVAPERLLDLAGVGGEGGSLPFDDGTDVDDGRDAGFDGVHH